MNEKKMNEIVYNYLNGYADNPEPQHAIMLTGRWGCGKSFFIKNWLKHYDIESQNESDTLINLRPIYVSLYGMKETKEITKAIDREINPFFYSKTGKIVKGIARIASKVVLKANIDIDGDNQDDVSFSGSIDSLTLFHTTDDNVIGKKFIVFDDFERCLIKPKLLLGYINYFVEHCGCHIIIIGDDTHFSDEEKNELNEFKEKTIGHTFEIQPDVESAVIFFLSESPVSNYLKLEQDFIIRCFLATRYNNLRILRQSLYDFKMQLSHIDSEYMEKENPQLHNLLGSFIAVYAEYHSTENHRIIKDYAQNVQFAFLTQDSNTKTTIQNLKNKYDEVSRSCIYHLLSLEYVAQVVNHLSTGASLENYMTTSFNSGSKELTSWERLSQYRDMEDIDFKDMCRCATEDLCAGKIILPYQIGITISYLTFFDAKRLYPLFKKNQIKINRLLESVFQQVNDLREVFQIRSGLLQGLHYLEADQIEVPLRNEILRKINDLCEQRASTLPNKMQLVLRTLTDETVDSLTMIDNEPYPDNSSLFNLKAVFEKEDGKKIFKAISLLSNKGRNSFNDFLHKHYVLNYSVPDDNKRFQPDLAVLEKLKELCGKKMNLTKGLEKLTYQTLYETLNQSIIHCKGVADVL